MNVNRNMNYEEILQCASCSGALSEVAPDHWKCVSCGTRYPMVNGQLDLRLRTAKVDTVQFSIGKSFDTGTTRFEFLTMNEACALNLDEVEIPRHLSRELISYFPKAENGSCYALDLGCGSGLHRGICEMAGYKYIGLDYGHPTAPMLGDAHALPFRDSSIDFVMSIAVLEHIRYPFLMVQEVFRVLKPGGKFIGTVAFLEPYHTESYYHHSHLGTFNVLQQAGFSVSQIAPNPSWSVLVAQSKVLFPRVPRFVSRTIVLPLLIAHVLYWKLLRTRFRKKDYSDVTRAITTSGSFSFFASRPTGGANESIS